MNESELAANFEDAVWYNEQTHADLGFVGKHVLSRVTRGMSIQDSIRYFRITLLFSASIEYVIRNSP